MNRFVVALGLMFAALAPVASAQPGLPPEQDPLVQNRDLKVEPGTDFLRYA